jgi:hypothetical protein
VYPLQSAALNLPSDLYCYAADLKLLVQVFYHQKPLQFADDQQLAQANLQYPRLSHTHGKQRLDFLKPFVRYGLE